MRRRSEIGVGFTDLLFNALLGFVVMFVLAFLLINPIRQDRRDRSQGGVPDHAHLAGRTA
jgi:hypothetical protein